MRTLSILLPYRGKVSLLEATLVSLLENRPAVGGFPAEIVVVLSKEYDDPYELAGEVTFVAAPAGASWVESVNLGLEHCRGAIVNLLACGVEASEGWADAVQAAFDDPQVAAVAPLVLERLDQDRVVSAGLSYGRGGGVKTVAAGCKLGSLRQSHLQQVAAPSALAGFYRRTALQRLGGFPALAGDGLATVDLSLRMAAVGYKTVSEPDSRLYAPAGAVPAVPRGYRAGLDAERLFLRHLPASGVAVSYAAHAMTMLAEALGALPRPSALTMFLGRTSAWRERTDLQAAARRLAERGHDASPAGGHSTQELLHMHRPRVTSRVSR